MKNIKNHYVITPNFNGRNQGKAFGFDSCRLANLFAAICLLGFCEVITESELERRFPAYFHSLVLKCFEDMY